MASKPGSKNRRTVFTFMPAIKGMSLAAHFASSGRRTAALLGSVGEVVVSLLAGDQTAPRMV